MHDSMSMPPEMSDSRDNRPASQARTWLQHYSPGVPAELTIPDRPLSWILEEAAQRFGAHEALLFYGTRITYARFLSLVNRFAHQLVRLGVQPGDRVSICLPNVPQFPIAFYGALKAGAIAVPTNPIYTGPELRHQLRDAGVRVVVALDMTLPTLLEIVDETSVEHIIVASIPDYLPAALGAVFRIRQRVTERGTSHKRAHDHVRPVALHHFKALVDSRGSSSIEAAPLPEPQKADDIAVLQYTGGTTGVAKGAMLTHRNLLANAMQAWTWSEQPLTGRLVTLCAAPFFHVYGLTVAMNLSIVSGSAMVLLPRFTVRDALKAIDRYRPDMFPGVPTMYLAIAREAERRHLHLKSIKVCISGSAPLPLEVQRRFEAISPARLVEGYGLTEASPVTHCNPTQGDRRIGTIGLPMPNTDAAIIDPETWRFLPPGEQGEIVVRGPQVMKGYWQRPDETSLVLRDGWLRTGDIGTVDSDGYFQVVDRSKDIIIASGLKIFPRDVDEVLFSHPKVLEAATVGIPDPYRGETVRAYVVVKPGEKLSEAELIAFCRERLAAYKVPKQVEFRESLPKTLVGKVLRRTLRDEYVAQHPEALSTETTTSQANARDERP